MPTYLDSIVAAHRRVAADAGSHRDLAVLEAEARAAGPVRDFRAGLRSDSLAVIAEIKRRSPSKGDLRPGLDPADLAREYEAGGAACLSVLTDNDFFGGSADDLALARGACRLPVLRKDFTVCEADVYDARRMGADAVLLIVAALSDDELTRFLAAARAVGLAALVEVHDGDELSRGLDAGADIIGVNQRNLRTFEVDRTLAVALAGQIPDAVVKVAESGIRHRGDAVELRDAGYDAILVGESLVTAAHPAAAVKELRA